MHRMVVCQGRPGQTHTHPQLQQYQQYHHQQIIQGQSQTQAQAQAQQQAQQQPQQEVQQQIQQQQKSYPQMPLTSMGSAMLPHPAQPHAQPLLPSLATGGVSMHGSTGTAARAGQVLAPQGYDAIVAADDGTDLDLPHHQPAKKFKHNIAERRRTSRLNTLFEELSQLVASRADLFSDTAQGHTKADVLITSSSCLRHCFSTIDQLKDRLNVALAQLCPDDLAPTDIATGPVAPAAVAAAAVATDATRKVVVATKEIDVAVTTETK